MSEMIVAAWARRHERLTAAATWVCGVAVFFRDPITTGFDTITGDRGDARLTIFLHEHWFQVVHGQVPWASPPQFYPTSSTLGYADTFFLNQTFYIPLRVLGLDPFAAFQFTLICLTAVGFASTFTILRRHLHVALLPACVLSSVAAFSNNLFVDTGHPQMYAVNFVPLAVLVVLEAVAAAENRGRRLTCLGVAGLLVGLLAYSNFYMGWFAIFVALIVGVIAAIIITIEGGIADPWRAMRSQVGEVAAFVGGFAIAMVPFLFTYAPVFDEIGGRSYNEVVGLSPLPGDLINVGRHNVVWGWLVRPLLGNGERLDTLHRAVAPTPVLLALTAWAALGLWRRRRRDDDHSAVTTVGLATSVAVFIVWLLPVRFAFGGAWAVPFRIVPGGSAIRVPGRIGVLNSVMACLAIGCYLSRRRQHSPPMRDRSRRAAWLLPALLIVAAAEQLNTTALYRRFDRSVELTALDVAMPPSVCRAFYIIDPSRTEYDGVSIDAILLAQHTHLPTVNGYSGQTPRSWNLRPWLPDYNELVQAWAARYGLSQGLCGYNLATRAWVTPV